MRNILLIAKREYLQRLLSPAFLITTLISFLLLVIGPMVPAFISSTKLVKAPTIAFIDKTGAGLFPRVLERYAAAPGEGAAPNLKLVEGKPEEEAALLSQAEQSNLGGIVVVEGTWPTQISPSLRSASVITLSRVDGLQKILTELAREDRARQLNVEPAVAAQLFAPIEFSSTQLGTGNDEKGFAVSMGVSYVMTMLIYMGILIYGVFVFQGVLEEKTSRVMEIMASTVRPFQLMAGKILGLGALGLTSYLSWVLAYLVLMVVGANALELPLDKVRPDTVLYLGVFFLGGYFLYATMFAAGGSLISRMEDSGTVQMPTTMLVVAMMLFSMFANNNPNGSLARITSLIPFFTPTVMLNRVLLAPPPLWEILLSIVLLFAAVILMTWLASRIYRVGILSYGSRPTLKQIWKFVRS